ncbi:MAG: penicillin amidase [Myxococcota bacterium]|jgi:penicillin amidase
MPQPSPQPSSQTSHQTSDSPATRAPRTRALLAVLAVTGLLAVPVTAGAAGAQRAESILPPGNAQTYTAAGEAARSASGDPDDAGPWIDDQREMYWDYEMKDASFIESPAACGGADDLGAADRTTGVETLRDGVDICWDQWGVPAVFGETVEDVWYGHGWAAAKLRLFLLEGAIRTGSGTLAELAGEGSLPQDIERRTTRYTVQEYTAMLAELSPAARTAIDEYVLGVNAYIAWITSPQGRPFMPAEYVLLSADPTPITAEGVAALGVEMVRFVASEGRTEIITAQTLAQLEASYGEERGRKIFRDLYWQEDDNAALTVLPEEGVFPRTSATEAERLAAFEAMADFAQTVPLDELRDGAGVAPWAQLQSPTLDSGLGDGTGDEPFPTDPEPAPVAASGTSAGATTGSPVAPTPPVVDLARDVHAMFQSFATAQEGASWMVMMSPKHTAGETLLMSEPQLDYDSGNFLVEVQLTGPGINTRGSTVAGLPVVGIGYTPDVAWALTTGNSKTIDTFIEQSRADSNDDGSPEYFHDNVWKEMVCHTEDVAYRQGAPLPVTPFETPFTETVQICRTVHGPVVAHTDDWSAAATWQWHVRDRELETIEATLDWQGAKSLADIEASIPKLTWNENIGAADRFGNIGFWHPGVHLERTTTSDLRLPIPGTGAYDLGDPLPQSALPHVVNPERGWIVNWNNKPAAGWLDGGGVGTTSNPAGPDQRVASLSDLVASRDDWTFDDLIELDREISQTDFRARSLLPLVLKTIDREALDTTGQAAYDLLAGWDRNPLGGLEWPGFADTSSENPATVGAAPTFFDEIVEKLDAALLGSYTVANPLLVAQQYMGRHTTESDTHLQLALRVLDEDYSSLAPLEDYLDGDTPAEVLQRVFDAAVDQLVSVQGDDVAVWRSVYFDDGRGERGGKDGEICTATGAVGPCGRHYFIERGAWVHHVGFAAAAGTAGSDGVGSAGGDGLAATGGGVAWAALLLLLAAAFTRRRSSTS